MTREDIIYMAREAGLIHYYDSEGHWSGVTNDLLIDPEKNQCDDKLVEILLPFAALVAAAEREACAKICDKIPSLAINQAKAAAKQIRARGE